MVGVSSKRLAARYLKAHRDVLERGAPKAILCDNGSEFSERLTDLWAYRNQVTLKFSWPGKTTDNTFIESFNRSLRDECLNTHWFSSVDDAKVKLEAWRTDYKGNRPHRSLNNLTPHEYAALQVAQLEKFSRLPD